MLTKVKCSNCGTKHVVNLEKRVYKPKYCTNCKSPIANLSPKLRVLSVFQRRKKERKQQTRQRFVDRIAILLWMQFKRKPTNQEIEAIARKGYVNDFEWEKD